MRKPTYVLKRIGTFYANLDPCDQCGGAGQQTFQFEAEVTTHDLDEHNFVIDNRTIPTCFACWQDEKYRASCEDLAAGGLLNIHQALEGRAIAIRVRVIANGDASVQLTWQRGESLPNHKPKAVSPSPRRSLCAA